MGGGFTGGWSEKSLSGRHNEETEKRTKGGGSKKGLGGG